MKVVRNKAWTNLKVDPEVFLRKVRCCIDSSLSSLHKVTVTGFTFLTEATRTLEKTHGITVSQYQQADRASLPPQERLRCVPYISPRFLPRHFIWPVAERALGKYSWNHVKEEETEWRPRIFVVQIITEKEMIQRKNSEKLYRVFLESANKPQMLRRRHKFNQKIFPRHFQENNFQFLY